MYKVLQVVQRCTQLCKTQNYNASFSPHLFPSLSKGVWGVTIPEPGYRQGTSGTTVTISMKSMDVMTTQHYDKGYSNYSQLLTQHYTTVCQSFCDDEDWV